MTSVLDNILALVNTGQNPLTRSRIAGNVGSAPNKWMDVPMDMEVAPASSGACMEAAKLNLASEHHRPAETANEAAGFIKALAPNSQNSIDSVARRAPIIGRVANHPMDASADLVALSRHGLK